MEQRRDSGDLKDLVLYRTESTKEDLKSNEILHMQVRLFRLACKTWGITRLECAKIFDDYDIDNYINEAYEFFHVQGDEVNLEDIKNYLVRKGASL
ncbi:MAG: DUF3791 domain-containing protein [Lachnospiraceae bacterium]|nr:DUF3791 domain-containing protein [Lachnospiraceae bacterium]